MKDLIQIYSLKVLLLGFIFMFISGCYDYDDYNDKFNKGLLPEVDMQNKTSLIANGVDVLPIKVIFQKGSNTDLLKVEFESTEGPFLETNEKKYQATEPISEGDILYVVANLKSTTSPGVYKLKMKVPNIWERTYSITYEAAPVTSIVTDKSKSAVKRVNEDEIQLFAYCKAANGLPSKGNSVVFTIADSINSDNSKYFRALSKTDGNGLASVYFSPGNFSGYTGDISFIASSNGIQSQAKLIRVIEPAN